MRFLILLLFLFSINTYAQDDIVAKEYFKNGEFEKALLTYKNLVLKHPSNRNYLEPLIKTHQQLEQYTEAQKLIEQYLTQKDFKPYLVELGNNYALQNDSLNANLNYNKALQVIQENPYYAGAIGKRFEMFSLLDKAIAAYEMAMQLNPDINYNRNLAHIYGEQGNIEKMFNSYINFTEGNRSYMNRLKREFSTFISENSGHENNRILRKILLKKLQNNPNLMWNEMLSWLFIQQKDYNKAFIQEKAIYKRQLESLDRIDELATIAYKNKQYVIAKSIFEFIIKNTQDIDTKIKAHYNSLKIDTEQANTEDYELINNEYITTIESYGTFGNTVNLQIAHAHFLAFNLDRTKEAITLLKNSLKLNLSVYNQAKIKLELGDILVLEEKFNEALIYYTQIQRRLKNSTASQIARFKVAKTSYYKGDFKWAESQLKILKASTSQLTANDALDLKLLISDNKADDSLQTALKIYAKADLLAFQNKNNEAITLLSTILKAHKTERIIPQVLLKQAQLFETIKAYNQAKINYETLIKDYKEGILIDDALFALAELYENTLSAPEKAKPLYESILFNHPDSIYFVEARKKFRALRGDAIN